MEQPNPEEEVVRGIKRRASAAFSDGGDEDFKGFDSNEKSDLADYSRIVGKCILTFCQNRFYMNTVCVN